MHKEKEKHGGHYRTGSMKRSMTLTDRMTVSTGVRSRTLTDSMTVV